MTPLISICLDVLIIALLGGVIFYAVRLNRSLVLFRQSRQQMDMKIKELSDATLRAESSIAGLRGASGDLAQDLQREIGRAVALRDELHFLVETGDAVASRMTAKPAAPAKETPRSSASPSQPTAPQSTASVPPTPDARSAMEKELLRTLEKKR
jgi:hypothetical protein